MSMIGNVLAVTNEELQSFLTDSSLLEDKIYNDAANAQLEDLDKTWAGILFVLTGESMQTLTHPLGRVLFSGQLVDEDQDLGYGPAHYLTPAEVLELNQSLASLTEAQIRERYDGAKMNALGIYPEVWDEEESFDYLYSYFTVLQQMFARAAQNNLAIITFIS
jgi:hypothetical protein